ncbi:hypothetical protein GLOTRDRAFT_96778 [Gloeophyllum trabeum ATCC 11539]|uniref:Uncharacterized protein n=1 Tax=Gloeophyllum trabeum (strain ATCC 11539 / FP-39264 / Madison 617) TaxID=670483 RepID=S7PU51_GLOTA|nr:uncharacterized protein GLOTRDRAFT_96778 [Gloeophyllum trabeum ATCC 11539]EPQ50857.1 hypothetical protein GLOTRDRAFT_96778 [Gloeophyllum trabeum ATCC 11539]
MSRKRLVVPTFHRVFFKEKTISAHASYVYSIAQTLPYELMLPIIRECLENQSEYGRPHHAIGPPPGMPLSTFVENQRAKTLHNQKILSPLLLVCQNWYIPARSLLYTAAALKTLDDVDSLASTLTGNPELARAVQSLYLVENVSSGRLSLQAMMAKTRYERRLRALLDACPSVTSLIIQLPFFKPEIQLSALGISSRIRSLTLNGRLECVNLSMPSPCLHLPPLHPEFLGTSLELPHLEELCLTLLELPPIQWPRLPALRTLRFVLCRFTRDTYPWIHNSDLRILELTGAVVIGSFFSLLDALQSKSLVTLESLKIGGGQGCLYNILGRLDFSALPALRSLTINLHMLARVEAEVTPAGLERAWQLRDLTIICGPHSLDIDELHKAQEIEREFTFIITNFISDPSVLPFLKLLAIVGDSEVWEGCEDTEHSVSRIDLLAIRCESRNVKLDKHLTPRVIPAQYPCVETADIATLQTYSGFEDRQVNVRILGATGLDCALSIKTKQEALQGKVYFRMSHSRGKGDETNSALCSGRVSASVLVPRNPDSSGYMISDAIMPSNDEGPKKVPYGISDNPWLLGLRELEWLDWVTNDEDEVAEHIQTAGSSQGPQSYHLGINAFATSNVVRNVTGEDDQEAGPSAGGRSSS